MSSDSTRQQLQQAYDLIRTNRKSEAQALLMPILKADEDNANAWWLLANALTDPAEIREALENVLRLRPGDAKAQKMLSDLNARSPADDFPMEETGFGGMPAPEMSDWMSDLPEKPKRGGQPVVVKPSGGGGTNPLVIILAIVGVLAVIGCAVCFLLPTIGISLFGQQIFEQVMTQAPELQEIFETITAMPGGNVLSGNLRSRGSIEYGQTVRGTVDTFDDDGWTFQGSAGDRVTIQVNATDNDLDPEVYLLNASNQQLGYDDDGGSTAANSELVVTLPANGAYTIRVSAFGQGGDYELILRRG
jgi:hypothetical protein